MDKTKPAVSGTEEVSTSTTASPAETQQTPSQVKADTAEKPVQTPVETADVPDELPTDPSEQAQAFAKMRRELKELKQGKEEKERKQSIFEQLKPSYSPQQYQQAQTQLEINKFVDPNTGEFQAYAYDQAVQKQIERGRIEAQQVAARAAQDTYSELRAKEKYPELDPASANHDLAFEKKVAAQYFFELYQGRQPDLLKLADEEAKTYFKDREAKQVAQQAKAKLTEKEQAALSPIAKSQPGLTEAQEFEQLKERSRHGDDWALAERMKRIKK